MAAGEKAAAVVEKNPDISNRSGRFERPSVDSVSIPKHHLALMQFVFFGKGHSPNSESWSQLLGAGKGTTGHKDFLSRMRTLRAFRVCKSAGIW